jgi:hypothetical protein
MDKKVKAVRKTVYRFSLASSGVIGFCFDLVLDGKPDLELALAEAQAILRQQSPGTAVFSAKLFNDEKITNSLLYLNADKLSIDNIIEHKPWKEPKSISSSSPTDQDVKPTDSVATPP